MPEKKPTAKKPTTKKASTYVAKAEAKPVVVTEVHIFKDELGEWRWRALAGNNKVVASSGEGLNNRMYAKKVAHDLYPAVPIYFV